jgi:hypothetical protein
MFKTKSVTLGDFNYTLTLLPSAKAQEVLFRVGKPLSAVLTELANSQSEGFEKAAAAALALFFSTVSPQDLAFLCQTFGGTTVVVYPDGRELPLNLELQNIHFSGHLLDQAKWLWACLEFNFSDFLAVAKGALKPPAETSSKPPSPRV